MASFRVLTDSAAKKQTDLLKFMRYVAPLAQILLNRETQTPFTVGIFGAWGTGKTSLLNMLRESLTDAAPDKFLFVDFNPWIHRHEPNMLVALLHTLHDAVSTESAYESSAKRIAGVLARLGADILLKSLTLDAVSLDRLEDLEKKYNESRQRARSTIRDLRRMLEAEVKVITNSGARRVVFFIDDLDRCEPTEILSVLEAVKMFLDLEHMIVVIAVDKEVVDRGVEIKYAQFRFAENRAQFIGAEYLEKMIQFPIPLYPLLVQNVDDFVAHHLPNAEMDGVRILLSKTLAPNPRKIKRTINQLSLALEIRAHALKHIERGKEKATLASVDCLLLARLAVIQVQHPELYAEASADTDLLIALERVYTKDLQLEPAVFNSRFQARGHRFHDLCKRYYVAGGRLEHIFKDSPFKAAATDESLAPAIAMLGG